MKTFGFNQNEDGMIVTHAHATKRRSDLAGASVYANVTLLSEYAQPPQKPAGGNGYLCETYELRLPKCYDGALLPPGFTLELTLNLQVWPPEGMRAEVRGNYKFLVACSVHVTGPIIDRSNAQRPVRIMLHNRGGNLVYLRCDIPVADLVFSPSCAPAVAVQEFAEET